MRCYSMAGPQEVASNPDPKTLKKGSKLPSDFAGRFASAGKLGNPVTRYVQAYFLTLRATPSVTGKDLGKLPIGTKISDAQYVGLDADKKYAFGFSKELGGYFAWMAGNPTLSFDPETERTTTPWTLYLTALPPQSTKGFIDPKQLALLMQTDWASFKPAKPAKMPLAAETKTPLAADTASQPTPTVPPKVEVPVVGREMEAEVEEAGMGMTATLGLLAVAAVAAVFLFRKKGA